VRIIRAFASRAIDAFGSTGFTHSRLTRGDVQVSLAQLDGTIGGHPAASRQLFLVLDGTVTVRTSTEAAELAPGEAALWEPGEWHESTGRAQVLLVEGDLTVFD
jgi:mannose-6-phosphate isomerase-like protein (cupin superfamily)